MDAMSRYRSNQSSTPAPISHHGNLQLLRGVLHGSPQPLMTLTAEVADGMACDLARLDDAVRTLADDMEFAPTGSGSTGIAMRLVELASLVQSHFGHPICPFRKVEPENARSGVAIFRLWLPYHSAQVAAQALAWAVRALNLLLLDPSEAAVGEGLRKELTQVGAKVRERAPENLNMLNFIKSAWEIGIPVAAFAGHVHRFGEGNRARLLDSTFTDRTPVIGTAIARHKAATAQVLRRAGLPVPDHVPVTSLEQALRAASQLGYPLVVKPASEDGGRGVFASLRDEQSLRAAVAESLAVATELLVEKHFSGSDYRITVVDAQVVKVEQRIAAGVVGDGVSTIGQLVQTLQQTLRFRKYQHAYGRMPVALDNEARGLLHEQGLDPQTVLAAGKRATLRRKNNISTGGEQVLIPTEQVHPDNVAMALRAAELLGLDIAGIDLLIPDIAISWLQTGAAICEVNAQPQIGVRTTPEIYGEILSRLLENRGRIATTLILAGEDPPFPPQKRVSVAARFSANGFADASGAWIAGERLIAGPLSAFDNFRNLLSHRRVSGAVCVMTPAEILRDGLPCPRFDRIVSFTNRGFDHILPLIAPHADRVELGTLDA